MSGTYSVQPRLNAESSLSVDDALRQALHGSGRESLSEAVPTHGTQADSAGFVVVPGAATGMGLTGLHREYGVHRRAAGLADPLGGTEVQPEIAAALHRNQGSGQPLSPAVSAEFGGQFGHDFGGVRIHHDGESDQLARSVQSVAFTHGTDIYFSRGAYSPTTPDGQHLLAHELSHVLQGSDQGAADEPNRTSTPLIGRADDPAESAADRTADGVMAALRRSTGPGMGGDPARSSRAAESTSVGLPQPLRRGLEHLSGLDLGNVRVHHNSARPARMGALAYTSGTEIELGPGQDRHLPHEGWHVVQQAEGRVAATVQAMDSSTGSGSVIGINDEAALEREADAMGARAMQVGADAEGRSATSPMTAGNNGSITVGHSALAHVHPTQDAGGVVQRVKGGLEYTEDTPTMLWAYNGKPFPANVVTGGNFRVGVSPMTAFRLGAGQDPQNADLGPWTNEDIDVLRGTAHVKLTNDVRSAEWIIERHQQDLPVDTFVKTMKDDIADMFTARDELIKGISTTKSGHPDEVGVTYGTKADTNAAPQVFIYRPGPRKGKAQITAKYTNEDTIERINKLNVSKYLTGTKVAEGEDIPRIAGTESQALLNADIAGTTSFSTADVLLNGLVGTSHAIPLTAGGGNRLTPHQVGLVKLMVINDALATTMVRYQDEVGQGQEKNIQRFFPKSRRNEYVKTIAQADLDAGEMAALEAEIRRTSAADAQLVFNSADPGTLRTDEAFSEVLALGNDVTGMMTAKQQVLDPSRGVPAPNDLLDIKTAVLGANGALLQTRIDFVALAYTELGAEQHYFHDPGKANQSPADVINYGVGGGGVVTNVLVTSRGYTDLHGDRGAVYEMREREIAVDKSGWFNVGSQKELNDAIERIFGAAQ